MNRRDRDPSTWREPNCFKYERFLNSDVDFIGANFDWYSLCGFELSIIYAVSKLRDGLKDKGSVLRHTFVWVLHGVNIGTNDVANAMGTSVGSGASTLRQAVLNAAVLEFSGALLMGRHVTSTMQKGILVAVVFQGKDMLLFVGYVGFT